MKRDNNQKVKSISENIAIFLFEASTLKRLKRTGWQILGENKESIAEHSFMVTVISFVLAEKLKANFEKVILMALFHDFEEVRTGDIYKLADLYVSVDKKNARRDAFSYLEKSDKITRLLDEFEEDKTIEAKIVHDADILALCLELKQLIEIGNCHAGEWFERNKNRLHLAVSKQIAEKLEKTGSQDWWRKEKRIIHRNLLKK